MSAPADRPLLSLVAMPWHAPHRPSLALGLLAALVRDRTAWRVTQYPAYLDWLATVHTQGVPTIEYERITNSPLWAGLGDWVFSPALYDEPASTQPYLDQLAARGVDPGAAPALREHAEPFVSDLADRILAAEPAVVGCSTTFVQTAASLALLRTIRQRAPEVVTVLGGANTNGPMGVAIHAAFPWVDIVVRGEGEPALLGLLAALEVPDAQQRDRLLRHVPGLCWRPTGSPDATQRVNPLPSEGWEGFDTNPIPDHGPYVAALDRLELRRELRPQLVYEGSRGCWWGEKHHCAFCGLNQAMLRSRVRPTETVFEEIATVVERTGIHDLLATENILAPRHLRELLPRIEAAPFDVELTFEAKANLKREELDQLAAAGGKLVQVGIESLIGRVLGLMDKGVSAAQNVRVLRDARRTRLSLAWNVLYGFPGEDPDDYRRLLAALDALWHLPPPLAALRISLVRFSPYHDDPSRGFPERRPAAAFTHHVYPDVPEALLDDLTLVFDTAPAGIDDDLAGELAAAVTTWQQAHPRAYLWFTPGQERDVITDGRQGPRSLVLEDPAERRLFRRAYAGTSRHRLLAADRSAERFLTRWEEHRLLFEDDGRVVALPVLDPRVRHDAPTTSGADVATTAVR